MLTRLTPVVVSGQEDTFALTAILWLYYESFGLPLIELLLELFHVAWKHPSLWKEQIVIRKIFVHRHQVFSQTIFTGDRLHTRKVVRALVWPHFCK